MLKPSPPVPQNVTIYGDVAFKEVIKLEQGWHLIQTDWCPHKKRKFVYTKRQHKGRTVWDPARRQLSASQGSYISQIVFLSVWDGLCLGLGEGAKEKVSSRPPLSPLTVPRYQTLEVPPHPLALIASMVSGQNRALGVQDSLLEGILWIQPLLCPQPL